jgi:hypothetical protein
MLQNNSVCICKRASVLIYSQERPNVRELALISALPSLARGEGREGRNFFSNGSLQDPAALPGGCSVLSFEPLSVPSVGIPIRYI